jgi:hypothetical protein
MLSSFTTKGALDAATVMIVPDRFLPMKMTTGYYETGGHGLNATGVPNKVTWPSWELARGKLATSGKPI